MNGGFSTDRDKKPKPATRSPLTSAASPDAGKPVKPNNLTTDPFGNKPDLTKRRGIPGGA